ncbi:MAG: hypothetical protein AAF821_25475 [Cyanobacteria bacterium P01_D01_bin.156]
MASSDLLTPDNLVVKVTKGAVMQPILFFRALPCVTAQLSAYGFRLLRRPVVWLALAAHGGLMLLPTIDLSAPVAETEVEPEPEAAPAIEAVSLSEILAPPEPVLPSPAEPPAPVAPVAIEPPVITEVPEVLEEILEETPPEEEFEEEFEEEPAEPQSFAFDPAQQSALSSSLGQFLGASNAGTNNFNITDQWLGIDPSDPIALRFRLRDVERISDPAAFFTPESIRAGTYLPMAGVTFKQIARNIDLVNQEGLGAALTSAGMTQVDEGPYGGHPFYGVYAADGQPVNYISLIDLKGTTLVFVWPGDPRQG